MKKLYKIVYLRKFNNQLSVIKIVETNEIKEIFRINSNKTVQINLNNVCYLNQLQKTYFIDFDSGNQYTFEVIETSMNPAQLDNLMSTKIIKEITSGIIDNKKEKILFVVVGFIIGIILGLLIMQIIMSNKIQDILSEQSNITPIIQPFQSLLKEVLNICPN